MQPTSRLYLDDDRCFEAEAVVVAVRDELLAFDRSCFYPGGGGQPPDEGSVQFAHGGVLRIVSARADDDDVVWHVAAAPAPPGVLDQRARLIIDRERRIVLARYHTVLHVLNTLALRDHGGWITGAQIGVEHSRIDFKLENFSPALCADLEQKANAVLTASHTLRSYYVSEEEFRRRDDLLRTLDAQPPIKNGRVRVVEIEGFDAQACGGTHVHSTAEIGTVSIYRTENKGKINKRLYVRLAEARC
jgi:misacylated tRNA(Ala) deacylase